LDTERHPYAIAELSSSTVVCVANAWVVFGAGLPLRSTTSVGATPGLTTAS
jgi:hypothetical protein